MEEAGMLMGIAGSCATGARTYAEVDGQLSFGWVDYDGKLMNGTAYRVDNNFNTLFELRGVVGTRLLGRLRGYVGVGYRRLFDELGHDPAGYDRTSQYVYSPLGLSLTTRLGETAVEARAEYRHFWSGRQKSELSDLSPGLPDVTNEQRHGYGWRLELSFETTRLGGRPIAFEPYVNHWSIEDSEPEQVGSDENGQPVFLYEPENNSTEIGFNLTAQF